MTTLNNDFRRGRRALRSWVVILAILLLIPQVSAHEPNPLELEPFEVENPKSSYALYGEFETGEEVFEVYLDLDEPFALPVEILVPRRGKWKDHRPNFAVVSPGLPEPTDEERALLPKPVPEGYGVYLERHDAADRPIIFESFTRRVFWTSTPVALRLGEGRTEMWIWSPDRTTGDFAFGFGVEEDGDFSKAFKDWSRYAY